MSECLVGLGLTFASDPDGAVAQFKDFKEQMNWAKAGEMAAQVAKGVVFVDEFEKGGKYALHATGRVGVIIGKTLATVGAGAGVVAMIKNVPAALSKKLDNAVAVISTLRKETSDLLHNFSPETFVRFGDDLADKNFFDWVNDPVNEKYVRGFVNHKLTDIDMQDIGGLLAELDNLDDLPAQARKWLENSESSAKFKYYRELGNALNKNIKTGLKSQLAAKSGALFDELKTQLGKTADELASYQILEEIPLNTPGGFMKADVMLIKRNTDGDITDAIILENKLSTGTQLTTRQKEGLGEIINGQTEMHVNYDVTKYGLKSDDIISVSDQKIFKIYDHGTDDISKVSIQKITSTTR